MRIALAGVGHWHAAMHFDAARAAGAEISGIWDESPLVAARFSAEVGGVVASSWPALLTARPDLLVLMGRADRLSPLVLEVLGAGIPLVLEKPAAVSAEALCPLMHAAAGRFVAVPLPNRLSPIWSEVRRLQGAERLGSISHAQFRIVNGPPSRYRVDGVDWVLDPGASGGGAMRNLGIHGFDAALMLAKGRELSIVSASVSQALYGEAVEEYSLVTLKAADDMIVSVEAGYTYASMAPGGDFEWRVSARNAYLVDRGDTCHSTTLDDGDSREITPLPTDQRYRAFMADTLKRPSRGQAPSIRIEDYWRAMQLIDRAYEKART